MVDCQIFVVEVVGYIVIGPFSSFFLEGLDLYSPSGARFRVYKISNHLFFLNRMLSFHRVGYKGPFLLRPLLSIRSG